MISHKRFNFAKEPARASKKTIKIKKIKIAIKLNYGMDFNVGWSSEQF